MAAFKVSVPQISSSLLEDIRSFFQSWFTHHHKWSRLYTSKNQIYGSLGFLCRCLNITGLLRVMCPMKHPLQKPSSALFQHRYVSSWQRMLNLLTSFLGSISGFGSFSHHSWKCSKIMWIQHLRPWFSDEHGGGAGLAAGLDDLKRSFPTLMIL